MDLAISAPGPSTPIPTPTPPTVPLAPSITATPGSGSVEVEITYNADNGGSPYTNTGQLWRALVTDGEVGVYTEIVTGVPADTTSIPDDTVTDGDTNRIFLHFRQRRRPVGRLDRRAGHAHVARWWFPDAPDLCEPRRHHRAPDPRRALRHHRLDEVVSDDVVRQRGRRQRRRLLRRRVAGALQRRESQRSRRPERRPPVGFNPSQLAAGDDGLTISLEPNPLWDNGYVWGGYQYLSGHLQSWAAPGTPSDVSTADFTLPEAGWIVVMRAKLSCSQYNGLAPGLWFFPTAGAGVYEFDAVQGAMGKQVGATEETANFFPLGIGYNASSGWTPTENPNVGFDASLEYHDYTIQFIPGVSWTVWVDGASNPEPVYQLLDEDVEGGITGGLAYFILLDLLCWDTYGDTDSFAFTSCLSGSEAGVGTNPVTEAPYEPYTGTMQVAELQAYSLPS